MARVHRGELARRQRARLSGAIEKTALTSGARSSVAQGKAARLSGLSQSLTRVQAKWYDRVK